MFQGKPYRLKGVGGIIEVFGLCYVQFSLPVNLVERHKLEAKVALGGLVLDMPCQGGHLPLKMTKAKTNTKTITNTKTKTKTRQRQIH